MILRYDEENDGFVFYAVDGGDPDPDAVIVRASHDGTLKEDGLYAVLVSIEDRSAELKIYTVAAENDGANFWAFRGLHQLWRTDHGSVVAGFPPPIEGYPAAKSQQSPELPWES